MYFRKKRLIFTTLLLIMVFLSIPLSSHADSQLYFTEKFLFEDLPISVLEEQVEITVKEDFQAQKKVEYLIKNISQKDEIAAFFATEENMSDLMLTLDGKEIALGEKLSEDQISEAFKNKTVVKIHDPLSKVQQKTQDFRIAYTSYPHVYKIKLDIKKGEFGKIILTHPSKSVISDLEPIINPIYTQTHQILPAKYFVNGAVVTLKLSLPETLKFTSSIKLNQTAEGNYIAILDKTLYSNWDINLISSNGLIFMTNQKAQNNETLLKTLGASFLFSIILYLVRRRELTKTTRTEFAPLKANIFGVLSLLLYLISIGLIYFFQLPSPYDEYWNYIYALVLVTFGILSYLGFKFRALFHFHFEE